MSLLLTVLAVLRLELSKTTEITRLIPRVGRLRKGADARINRKIIGIQ